MFLYLSPSDLIVGLLLLLAPLEVFGVSAKSLLHSSSESDDERLSLDERSFIFGKTGLDARDVGVSGIQVTSESLKATTIAHK